METPEARMPLIGEKFPEMRVKTTQGIKHIPSDYSGRWLVLFSHPSDFTPVCTTEFVSFNRHYDDFQKMNCDLLGLSVDQVFSHMKWIEWIGHTLKEDIRFPIIADDLGLIAKQLGFIHGRATNTVRAVMIIDPDGFLRAMLYYPAELGRNMQEILRMVKGLQISDAQNVAMPANWPENEIIGDEVIVPPPTDVQGAQQRLKQYQCYDWWFCHKPLPEKAKEEALAGAKSSG